MGYRAMTVDMLYNLYRRWAVGQKPMEISRQSGLHRSTCMPTVVADDKM